MLHHGSRLLLLAQSTVHAFGFPFLCIGRFSLCLLYTSAAGKEVGGKPIGFGQLGFLEFHIDLSREERL